MKLMHLTKYYWPDNGGGVAAAMDMIVHAFKKYSAGHENFEQEIICCWQENGKPYKEEVYNDIKVNRCKSLFEFASTQFSPQFLSAVNKKTKDADIVIHNFPYPFVDLAILLGKVHGKIIVWWHCDYETLKGKILAKLYAPLVNNTLKKADAIVVSAQGNIDGSNSLKQYKDKCHIIPFAVDESVENAGKEYFEKRLHQDSTDDVVHILFIGRFVWYKGISVLLEAYSRLNQNKYSLTLVGTGSLLKEMEDLAKNLKIKNIQFTGSVSDEEKYNWIKWCDFLVLPSVSKAEAFAIVQIEAMAYGKPVINTLLPSGVPDVCPNDIAGITVKPNDSEELYMAIKRLGENMQLREQYGKNAIDLVSQKYSMKVLDENYKLLFDHLKQGSNK